MADARLERVEERIAWLERHVIEQDKAMLELGEELRRLTRELLALRERTTTPDAGAGEASANERPPHY